MNLGGRTALVTGAGGALGSAIVRMLIDADARAIIALDKDANALAAIKHASVVSVACDATDPAALEGSLKGVLAEHAGIEILVNNAGILHSAPLVNVLNQEPGRFSEAAAIWQRVVGVNLSAAFYVTQLVADRMVRSRTKGVIVNMSSVSAQGTAGQGAYAASKAGLEALTRVWAKELGLLGIRCVAVAPGYIDTPSTHAAVAEATLRSITDRVPLRRLGNLESILQAVRFAIENDYASGTTVHVDGGLTV